MNYDVFISSKSEDYHLAEEVYDFLTKNGLSAFIASEELQKIGEAQYANAIDEALDESVHMVVVASSLSHINSKWVRYEWSTFSNDLKSGYRDGNLLTILSGSIELKSLPASLRHQQSFHFDSYKKGILDYLKIHLKKEGKTPTKQQQTDSSTFVAVFKFYSNENCQILLEGKVVGTLEGMSDEPYYLPVSRKGDYRFKAVNLITTESKIIKEHIDSNEEKDVEIEWEERKPFKSDQEWPENTPISGEKYVVDLGVLKFNMIRVEGGEMEIGATCEQVDDAEGNEHPAHKVNIATFYFGQFPITQNVWEIVMGYNKSHYKNLESERFSEPNAYYKAYYDGSKMISNMRTVLSVMPPMGWLSMGLLNNLETNPMLKHVLYSFDKGHYPVENISHDEALEFVRRLSKMTNIPFSLPTEEEWEYAARGGQKSQGFKYAGSDNIDEVAWYRANSNGTTHPVGEKKPNELGLYDMSGNVWEWTETPAHSYATDIEAGGNIYIRRGGSWWHEAKNCRVARRYASDHSKKTSGLGLRVVISGKM